MYYILRNNQPFGPYSIDVLKSYTENGKILKQDRAYATFAPQDIETVGYFLKSNEKKVHVKHSGNIFRQLNDMGRELIFPRHAFSWQAVKADSRLFLLTLLGLAPAVLIRFFSAIPFLTFYVISLYFAIIWGLFFFHFFKTSQIKVKTTIILFFTLQACMFVVWDVLGLPNWIGLNTLYRFTESPNLLLRIIGFVFGVGLLEETVKAIPLLLILYRAKAPYIPRSMVFYGLMSGISFGVFEGVQYQMMVNVELDYSNAFFMNVARLTSLPFLHAIWAGMAGYFLAFAQLYPKYRLSLYFLAIAIPSVIHGFYDVLGWNLPGLFLMLASVLLLMSYLKQSVNYQSKLSK